MTEDAFDRKMFVQDDDCHWYIIPSIMLPTWNTYLDEFREAQEKIWDQGEEINYPITPEWAVQVDGPHTITFTDPQERFYG